MIGNIPAYVSITFILTTFLTVGFLFYALRQTVFESTPAKILFFLIPFWLFFQAALTVSGFYFNTETVPPHIFIFAVFPALLLVILFFIFFRRDFISKLPLKTLTLLSIVRIPVEIVLFWLFQNN